MYNNKTRPDMGEGCKEKLDLEFLRWVLFEGRKKRQKMLDELDHVKKLYPDKQIYIFRRTKQSEELLKQISKGMTNKYETANELVK